MAETILLVEDNPDIMNINRKMLARNGYRVLEAETLQQAEALLAQHPDLVILDIILPDGSGLEFCRQVRRHSWVPILFLTALETNGDIVAGFNAGGDGYLAKPYDLDVLLARVAALLRRAKETALATEIVVGPLRLDLLSSRAILDGNDVHLTQKEFSILLLLVKNQGQQVSAQELYETAWGMDTNNDVRAVRPQISRLRVKLSAGAGSPFDIIAKYGQGYCFVVNATEEQ